MRLLTSLRTRLRRRPVDPEQALRRAQADAQRRAARERTMLLGSGGGFDGGGL